MLLKGVVCGYVQISMSLLPTALSQPSGETEVLDHRAPPQYEIPEHLYLFNDNN